FTASVRPRNQMLRNVGRTWALTIVTVAVTYVLTPSVIHVLGRDGYGPWTLITAVTGYVSLMALGVPTACVRFLAQHVAERHTRQINATIGSCAGAQLKRATRASRDAVAALAKSVRDLLPKRPYGLYSSVR